VGSVTEDISLEYAAVEFQGRCEISHFTAHLPLKSSRTKIQKNTPWILIILIQGLFFTFFAFPLGVTAFTTSVSVSVVCHENTMGATHTFRVFADDFIIFNFV